MYRHGPDPPTGPRPANAGASVSHRPGRGGLCTRGAGPGAGPGAPPRSEGRVRAHRMPVAYARIEHPLPRNPTSDPTATGGCTGTAPTHPPDRDPQTPAQACLTDPGVEASVPEVPDPVPGRVRL